MHHLLFNMSKHNRSTKSGTKPVVCHNPFCTRQQKAFSNNAAFQKHLAVMPQCQIFLETHYQHVYHVHTARAPSLPRTMARNAIEVSNSIKDTNKKRKCSLLRNMVNVLDEQVPIPDPPVGVIKNDTPIEPFLMLLIILQIGMMLLQQLIMQCIPTHLCIQQTRNGPCHC